MDPLASIARVLKVELDDLTQAEAAWSGFFRMQERDVQASYADVGGIIRDTGFKPRRR